jgi:threonine synthase
MRKFCRGSVARAHRGLFTEPAGGTEVAVAKKLIAQEIIPRDESIVISITAMVTKRSMWLRTALPNRSRLTLA